MPLCIVPGCVNRSGENYKTQIQKELEKSIRMTFHKLPLNPVKRKRWLDALNITEPRQKRPVVCSLHFEEKAFDRTSLACVRLREGAIPRVIEPSAEDSFTTTSSTSKELVEESQNLQEQKPKVFEGVTFRNSDQHLLLIKSVRSRSTSVSPERFSNQDKKTTLVSRSTSVSPERRVAVSETEYLQKALENTKKFYRKKLKTLLQKHRRSEKRVAALKDILVSLNKDNTS